MVSASLYLGQTPRQYNALNGTASLIIVLLIFMLVAWIIMMSEGGMCINTAWIHCFRAVGVLATVVGLGAGIYFLFKYGNPGVQVYSSSVGVPLHINL